MKAHLLLGLPGSGKTTFATSLGVDIVDLDKNPSKPFNQVDRDICVDGLFSMEGVKLVIQELGTKGYKEFILHIWEPDKQLCLHNDYRRVQAGERKNSSARAIFGNDFNVVVLELELTNYCNQHSYSIIYEKHKIWKPKDGNPLYNFNQKGERVSGDIVKKRAEDLYVFNYKESTEELTSDCWYGEGETWGGYKKEYHPAEKPLNPKEAFSKILEKLSLPNLSIVDWAILQEKRLITIKEKRQQYYDNRPEYCWTIKTKDLSEYFTNKTSLRKDPVKPWLFYDVNHEQGKIEYEKALTLNEHTSE